MTNAENYLKDGVVAEELWKKFQEYYYKNKSEESDVGKAFINFFEQQVKLTLTDDERTILRNISREFYFILRIEGHLFLKKTKYGEMSHFTYFDRLFQSIKNGEEYSIEELLGDDKETSRKEIRLPN